MTYTIDYGDGDINSFADSASAMNISHVYEFPGYYTPTFIVTDSAGCQSSVTVDSLINIPGPSGGESFSNSVCSTST